ncbi:MAG: LBF_2804 family protein, partial [Myxococcaceae bacterium]
IIGAVTIVASAIEIALLYWDALRSVHQLSHVAGLELFPPVGDGPAVAGALARAALELPNPSYQVYGVDPHREASRLRLLVASVAYKAKVSVTNFAIKALVRRALGRAAVRTFAQKLVPFVAVPITAVWNGVVTWLVLREARLRAMGPSAAKELVRMTLEAGGPLSPQGNLAAIRAVASAIVRTRDLHPNLLALLLEVRGRCGAPVDEDVDDAEGFLGMLPGLAANERTVALQLLSLASVIDGRLTAAEKKLVGAAQLAAGRPVDLAPVQALRRAFMNGDPLGSELLAGLG